MEVRGTETVREPLLVRFFIWSVVEKAEEEEDMGTTV